MALLIPKSLILTLSSSTTSTFRAAKSLWTNRIFSKYSIPCRGHRALRDGTHLTHIPELFAAPCSWSSHSGSYCSGDSDSYGHWGEQAKIFSYGCFRRNLLSGPRLAISMTSMMGVVTQIPARKWINLQFVNPSTTSENLFALLNGDDIYNTYQEMSKMSLAAWIFSKVQWGTPLIIILIWRFQGVLISQSTVYDMLYISSSV